MRGAHSGAGVFTWPVRVYWEDTDGGGIVYYANYLRFLERARTEWLRSLGHSQRVLAQEAAIVFAVVSLNVEYRLPARLDDELSITCEPVAEGAATIRFAQRIYALGQRAGCIEGPAAAAHGQPQSRGDRLGSGEGRLLVEASVRIACLDAQTLRPRRLPESLRASDPP